LVNRWAAFCIAILAGACAFGGAPGRPIPDPQVQGGLLKLDFYWLSSYEFIRPTPDTPPGPGGKPATGEEQIPTAIWKWSGARSILTGFMVPTNFKDGKTTEFLLMANLMLCCYGTVPKVNDWVLVRIPGGTEVVQDRLLSFTGAFHVGAQIDDGILTAVYELDADGPGSLADE
jgi:hypothetical protein